MLLVDDIQFSQARRPQTEFFHTFNHLHGSGKQIVIASDRSPHELSGPRGTSGQPLPMGLCVDVQPPDLRDQDHDPFG